MTPRPPILILIFQSSISYSIVAIKTVRRLPSTVAPAPSPSITTEPSEPREPASPIMGLRALSLVMGETDLVELDTVEGAHVDEDASASEHNWKNPEQHPQNKLDPSAADTNKVVSHVRIMEHDTPRQMGRLGALIGNVDHGQLQRGGGNPIQDGVIVHIAKGVADIRFAVCRHTPDVELEVGRPFVHEVVYPRAIIHLGHLVGQPTVVSVLVESTVNEEMRVSPVRRTSAVQITFNDVVTTSGRLRPVLDLHVVAFPSLITFRSGPSLRRKGIIPAVVVEPVRPHTTPRHGETPLVSASSLVVDVKARLRDLDVSLIRVYLGVIVLEQQCVAVVGAVWEDNRVLFLADSEHEVVVGASRCVFAGAGDVVDVDGVDAIVHVLHGGTSTPDRGARAIVRGLEQRVDGVTLDAVLVDGCRLASFRIRGDIDVLREGIAIHQSRETDLNVHRAGFIGASVGQDSGIVARKKPANDGGRLDPLVLWHERLPAILGHVDTFQTAIQLERAVNPELSVGGSQ
ncbi:glycosyltransferase family 5 protein [Hortaea werneckii]|nr:glycosyltransferase family 5 protein [Hortaea werneckii]